MKLLVKNKAISLLRNSIVTNEKGEQVFFVKGVPASPSSKKIIYDKNKKICFIIKNKLIHQPFKNGCLIYDEKNNLVAELKETKLLGIGFEVTGCEEKIVAIPNENGRYPLIIKMGKEIIGSIKPKFMTIMDTYELDVKDEEDAAFLVALTIANDNIHDEKRNK